MTVRPIALAGLCLLAIVAGCGRTPITRAPEGPTPSPAAAPRPAAYRVAIVDLPRLVRAHRRWPELQALLKKTEAVQVQLSSPPPPPDMPRTPGGTNLQAEADRLKRSLQAELTALEGQLQRRLEAYVNDLRAEQEARLADRQRELNAELQKVAETKRDELQRDLERFELATMAEYRIPLTNLRVKADVVGVTNEEEGKRLREEGDRIQKERDEKIRARAQTLEKQFNEFQDARTRDAEANFKALVTSLEEEARAKINAQQEQAQAEMQAAIRERESRLARAMEARRKIVVEGMDAQVRAAQERYARQVEAQGARLRTELQALGEQRLRLEDAILAEIKIEVATIAQGRQIDVVLTRGLSHPGVIDLTPDVIARLRRS